MSEGSSQHGHCLKHSFWTILSCLKMPSPGGPGTGNRPRIRWRAGKLIVPQAEPEAKRAKIEQEVVAFDEVPCWSTKTAKKQDEEPTKKSDSEGTQKEPKTANCKPMASASLHQAPSVHSEAVQWHVQYNGTWRSIQFRSGDWRAVCGSKAAYPLHERTCHACGYVLPAVVGKKLLACNACWQVHYCNRSCQKQGWKEHRNVCDDALIEL